MSWRPPAQVTYGTSASYPPTETYSTGRNGEHWTAPSIAGSRSGGTFMPDSSAGNSKRKADPSQSYVSKEEILKEKNRIKQRNLRERRAQQLHSLEGTVTSLNESIDSLQQTLHDSRAREQSLRHWVEALESALLNRNLGQVAMELRTRFGRAEEWRESLDAKPHTSDWRPSSGAGDDGGPQSLEQQPLSMPDWHCAYPTRKSVNPDSLHSSSSSASGTLQNQVTPPLSPRSLSVSDLVNIWPRQNSETTCDVPAFTFMPVATELWETPGITRVPPSPYPDLPIVPAGNVFWATVEPPAPFTHPTIHAARQLLSHLYQSAQSPLPQLPSLTKPRVQHLLLLALRNMSTPQELDYHTSSQIANLPPQDAAVVLAHAESPTADPRIINFPSVLIRLRIIQAGPQFDLTSFIASVFQSARIYGQTADFHAWEMPSEFWTAWATTIPGGKIYCASLKEWRRRDGHRGVSVQDLLMGYEEPRSRRTDSVGYPPGWRFARQRTPSPPLSVGSQNSSRR